MDIALAQTATQLAQTAVQAAATVALLKQTATLPQQAMLQLIQRSVVPPPPAANAPGVGTLLDIRA